MDSKHYRVTFQFQVKDEPWKKFDSVVEARSTNEALSLALDEAYISIADHGKRVGIIVSDISISLNLTARPKTIVKRSQFQETKKESFGTVNFIRKKKKKRG